MTPGVPDRVAFAHDLVRVAEAGGDVACAELVVVAVPYRLAGQRRGHVEAQRQRDAEEPDHERPIAGGQPAAHLGHDTFFSRIRRRYVRWTCAGSRRRYLASSVTK